MTTPDKPSNAPQDMQQMPQDEVFQLSGSRVAATEVHIFSHRLAWRWVNRERSSSQSRQTGEHPTNMQQIPPDECFQSNDILNEVDWAEGLEKKLCSACRVLIFNLTLSIICVACTAGRGTMQALAG